MQQTQGASSLWGGSSNLSGLESNWGIGTPYSSGANNNNLLGYGGGGSSLSSNSGHMQIGASSAFGDSINSNPMLGNNNNRGSWGAPGTLPPSQSTNRLPSSSNMQGSLPVSGAQPNGPQQPQSQQQSGAFTSSQSLGPNSLSVSSSQGNSAFGSGSNLGFQKISTGNSSTGLGMNPATSINNNSSNAQSSDNLDSTGWGVPISTDSRLMGTNSWGNGNPSSSSGDWDQQPASMSQSQSQQLPSASNPQYSQNSSSTTTTSQANPTDPEQRPSSWAQAAGKGLNLQPTNPAAGAAGNTQTPEELQRQENFRVQIESHEGWGKKPVRQETKWNIETSPKVQRKFSTAVVPDQQKGTNNMWNNNNGTAIWEANKDNNTAWNAPAPVARPAGQPPSNWNSAQKPPDPSSGQWGGPGGVGPGQAPGPNKTEQWGGQGGPPNPTTNSNWGGTETGSWSGNFGAAAQGTTNPNPGNGNAIATWGEREASAGWNPNTQRNSGVGNDGTALWGDPQSKPAQQQQQQPPNWQNAPGAGTGGPPNPQAMGQMAQNPGRKMGAGWGDPMGPPDPKTDDGTSLWAANNQQQARAAGWGDTGNQGQWNPALFKQKPPVQNPAQYGGVDEMNWNLPKEDIWSEESMGGWDDADMGTWNDSAQQNNSTWNSATGFNRDKQNSVKDGSMMKFPGGPGSHHPTQMRSRLLQQLMDLGFKKDEAQHALITSNMNIQNAIAELYNRRGNKRDGEADMYNMDGSRQGVLDDISDTQQDSNSFVPNMKNHMQNTPPFNNAQSKIPNQFPFNNGPSLNSQSSLAPSINPGLQQKIIHKLQNQQMPPSTPQSMNSMNPPNQGSPMGQGPLPGGSGGQQNPQSHHMAQQQILHQLRLAVQAGVISPQLLNRQLPMPMLVMLQQLIQQQQMLQQLITSQQILIAQPITNPAIKMQLDGVQTRIEAIKAKIVRLQVSIASAQNTLLKNPQSQASLPPQQSSPDQTDTSNLQSDMNNLSVSTSQPQSRLNTMWKQSTPDKESPTSNETTTPTTSASNSTEATSEAGSLNKAPGAKTSEGGSMPRRFDELGLSNLGGDTTWSTTPTSSSAGMSWPSTDSAAANSDGESKESQSSNASTSGESTVLDSIPAIPEFVPGKPWQGITKNVDDDPHITPGTFARSLSVNTVKDDYLTSLTKSSPNNDSSGWPPKPQSSSNQAFGNKPWSTAGENLGNFSNDMWGIPKGNPNPMSRPPPGLPQQKSVGGNWSGVNRQHSWAAGQARPDGNWDNNRTSSGLGAISTALVLKNLTPQIDGSTLRTLCMQHGPLQCFYLNLAHGQALVKYSTKEEAMKAQKSLHTCLFGNTTIVAEFVSDVEALRFVEQSAMSSTSAPSQWNQSMPPPQINNPRQSAIGVGSQRHDGGMSSWGSAPPPTPSNAGTSMWGNIGGGNPTNSGSGMWGDSLEDNSTHNLLGNMLGETM